MAGGEKKLMGCDVWIRLQTQERVGSVQRIYWTHYSEKKNKCVFAEWQIPLQQQNTQFVFRWVFRHRDGRCLNGAWISPVFITDDGNETHSFVLTINFTAIQVLVLVIKPRFVHFFPLFSWGKCESEKHRCPEGRLTWHQRVTTCWYAGSWGRNGGS